MKLTKKLDRDNLHIAIKALSKLGIVQYINDEKLTVNNELGFIQGRVRCSSKGFCFVVRDDQGEDIYIREDNLNENFFIYQPNSLNNYNSKITFEDQGLKLFRPNKYWVSIENQFDFNEDFEIIIHLSIPEIPWETQTLISNTSAFTGETQSWKVDIDDGRLFFSWTNSDGEYVNQLGDKSLRSGVLVQKNGKISNTSPPIVDPSFLSQLTTAHNGYLTFSVEFGIFISILFYSVFFIFILKQL